MICYSDEEFIEKVRKVVIGKLKKDIENGAQIGIDLHGVDIADSDTGEQFKCKNCQVYMKKYSNSVAAPMMEYVNTIARDVMKIDSSFTLPLLHTTALTSLLSVLRLKIMS